MVFIFRVVGVEKLDSVLIVKDRAGLIEGNSMLSGIGLFFPVVPLETQLIHMYIVCMNKGWVKMIINSLHGL